MRQGLIEANPGARIQQLRETPWEKGVLALEEARRLLDENKVADTWKTETAFAANLLSATTGLRLGEVLALRVQDIRDGRLIIKHSWDRAHGLKGTKTGRLREVPMPGKTARWLLCSMGNRSTGFVFSANGGASPVYDKVVTAGLYDALEKMGISPEERKLRNVSFHSWRHFYNSVLRGRVSDAKLRRLTGHSTAEMTERYSHFKADDFRDVLAIQEELAI